MRFVIISVIVVDNICSFPAFYWADTNFVNYLTLLSIKYVNKNTVWLI